jgi:type II secretory pathway component PulJ
LQDKEGVLAKMSFTHSKKETTTVKGRSQTIRRWSFAKILSRSFTLIEALIVVMIIFLLAGMVWKFLQTSQRSWFSGRDQLTESRLARIAVAQMDKLLRQSNPSWDATHGVAISDANKRIDFYIPNFYSDCCPGCDNPALCTDSSGVVHTRGELMSLSKVTFKLNPNNPTQLLEKIGNNPERIIVNNVNNVNFSCGCGGCMAVDDSCPVVAVSITTFVQAQYTLTGRTELRNQNIDVDSGVAIQEPSQGGL